MKQTLDLEKLTQRHAAIHALTGQLQHLNTRVPVVFYVKTEKVAHITQESILKGKNRFPRCSFQLILYSSFLYLMSFDFCSLRFKVGVFLKNLLE